MGDVLLACVVVVLIIAAIVLLNLIVREQRAKMTPQEREKADADTRRDLQNW